MAEPSTTKKLPKDDVDHEVSSGAINFFKHIGVATTIPDHYSAKDFYSSLVNGHLEAHEIKPGHVTCLLSVKPGVANYYGGLHGGAVAAVAERLAIACARTIVAEDKEIFLGELSMSYLSAAPKNAELIVDASIVRSGRNVTMAEIVFKIRNSRKLVYTSHATFYNMPIAKL